MPIFEFKCKKCKYKFEKLVFGKERVKCPKCGSASLEKLISSFNISKKNSKGCQGETCDICKSCNF